MQSAAAIAMLASPPARSPAMRKPRDFDTALRALTDKTKALKETKRRQLGDLVVATGADALDMDMLAGGLLTMVGTKDAVQKESWRQRGAAFFRGATHESAGKSRGNPTGGSASDSGQTSA
jgi:Conjugal transfer protein TraD